MPKVKVKNYRLFIAESTAQLIIAQRERVQARYPDTPLTRLPLFPRDRSKNPHGIIHATTTRLISRPGLGRQPAASRRPERRGLPSRACRPLRVPAQLRAAPRGQRHAARRTLRDDGPHQDGHHARLLQGQQVPDAQGRRASVGDAAHPPR